MPQPPFSPEVSTNDFLLYGMLKDQIKGEGHEMIDGILASIDDILSDTVHRC